ncbi:hypothetical protein D3C80_1553950 [compost metagenome]
MQWRQLRELLSRFQFLALAGGNFIGRRHQQYVADLALVQPLGLEHQIKCLVPGHTLQAQGNVAFDSVAGDQVEPGKIRNQLQHRAHVDVLEIQ